MNASPPKSLPTLTLGLALAALLAATGCDRRTSDIPASPRNDSTATPEIVPASPASGPASDAASDPASSSMR